MRYFPPLAFAAWAISVGLAFAQEPGENLPTDTAIPSLMFMTLGLVFARGGRSFCVLRPQALQ